MKYLVLFAIFAPILSIGQTFELSEQGGYSMLNDRYQKS